jgi:ribosomal protein S18 acetylase RimI-like enzyme
VKPADYAISSEPAASPDDVAVVREGLHQFNFAATGMTQVHSVSLLIRDGGGVVRGGLLGYVWAGWLHIEYLWMAQECRGRGLGSELLARAEQEAVEAGAGGAFLSTFDFQAPEFYKSRGYEVFGTLAGYPPGHIDYHLRKVFRVRGAAEQADEADEALGGTRLATHDRPDGGAASCPRG